MPNSLDEQILDVVAAKVALISGVTTVRRALVGPAPLEVQTSELNLVEIRHLRTTPRWHIRGAYECIAQVELCAVTAQADHTIRNLVADLLDMVDTYNRWNDGSSNLAERSWTGEVEIHEPEVSESVATATLQVFIKFYSDRTDPTAVKEI